jgi:ABC-2 type transport system permease protein
VLAFFAFSTLPTYLANHRERRVLRRLATTPVGPSRLLLAEMAMSLGLAALVVALVLGIGAAVFGTDLPRNPLGFLAAFLLATVSLFAIGLVVAARAPSERFATGIGLILFYPMNFFAGLWLPRDTMPEALRRIGDFTPLGAGVQSLQDSLAGAWPRPLDLAVMAVIALVAGLAAARWFRWE